jgi:hypothetical protein
MPFMEVGDEPAAVAEIVVGAQEVGDERRGRAGWGRFQAREPQEGQAAVVCRCTTPFLPVLLSAGC